METLQTKRKKLNQEETLDSMVNKILENFDFGRCSFVMRKLDWEWHGRGVPTIEMLKKTAKDHLMCAAEGCLDVEDHKSHLSPYFCSSGGLKATAWRNKYRQIEYLELEFVLTEWNCDGDDI